MPITHTVKVFKEKNLNEQIGETQIVDHGAFAKLPEGDVSNGNFVFLGWFYEDTVNGQVVEKAFVFDGIPVLEDMNIYARWGSYFSVDYKIYYRLESGEDIADPTEGSAIVGNNKTFYAKTENDLYEGYRMGYYPKTSSHTVTMSAEGNHVFIFYYEFVESMPYKVQYINAETGKPIYDEKRVMDNSFSVVTETFIRTEKMMPDAYQKRLVLSSNTKDEDNDGIFDANVITFYYSPDEIHAYYRVVHYIQNIGGNSFREFRSEEKVGLIDGRYEVSALELTGFRYNEALTFIKGDGAIVPGEPGKVSGQLTSDGALIEFYYERIEFNYIVKYIDRGTNKELADSKQAKAAFGLQIIEYAPNFEAKGYALSSENAKMLTISANEEMNVIEFYYQEKNVTLKYSVIGPEGCGRLSQESENVAAINGKPGGSSPLVNNGFIFLGWYLDADCTREVDPLWVTDGLIKPQKTDAVWKDAVYYAKFEELETEMKIKTVSTESIDTDQTFIFHIVGKAGTDTANVNLHVSVTGNNTVTVTALPVGVYTVTMKTDWSWRYENPFYQKEVRLTYSGDNELVFDNDRENAKWLDGNAVKNNLF